MKIKNRLGDLIEWRGLLKYQFAKKLGVDRQLVTRWCQNQFQPMKYIKKICRVLDVPVSRLFYAEHNGEEYDFVTLSKKH